MNAMNAVAALARLDLSACRGCNRANRRRRISRFLNDLARPHVLQGDLAEGYKAMAADEEREREAT